MAEFRESNRDEETFKYDRFAHAVTVISEPHRMTHDGFMYHLSGRATVASGANLDMGITTAPGTFVHWRKLIWSLQDSPCDVKVYEAAAFTGGVAQTILNQNRASSNVSTTVMVSNPDVTEVGTIIHDRYIVDQGGPGTQAIGIIAPTNDEEWILNDDTKYLVRLTNNSGGDIIANFEFQGYEIGYTQ